jgi:hypothetical protein
MYARLVLSNSIVAQRSGPLQRASKAGAIGEKNVIAFEWEYTVVGQDNVGILDSLQVVF